MRVLMMLSSALLVMLGTFCIANSAAAFTAMAFIVGAVLLAVGVLGLIVYWSLSNNNEQINRDYIIQSIMAAFVGVLFISGQVTEDMTVLSIFGMTLILNGLAASLNIQIDLKASSSRDKLIFGLGLSMMVVGVYIFYDSALLNLHHMILIGIASILMGLDRFRVGFDLNYSKPEFMSKNEEKLDRALRERKKARRIAIDAARRAREQEEKIKKLEKEIKKEKIERKSRVKL